MSRLWVFDIDSDFATGYGLVSLRARERNRYEIVSAFPELEREIGVWRVPYTYQPKNPRHVQRTRQLRQIFTSYKVRSLRFTCYGTRAFSCSTTRACLQQWHNRYVNVYSGVLLFFYIEQRTIAQLLRGEVCLILRTDFYNTFVARIFQYFREWLNNLILYARVWLNTHFYLLYLSYYKIYCKIIVH